MTGTRKSSRKRLAPSWGGEAPLASSTLTAAALGRFGTLVEFIAIWIRNLTELVPFYPVRKRYLSFFLNVFRRKLISKFLIKAITSVRCPKMKRDAWVKCCLFTIKRQHFTQASLFIFGRRTDVTVLEGHTLITLACFCLTRYHWVMSSYFH